jgi:hypothetical protein
MAKEKKTIINVQGLAVNIISQSQDDYISITDIARHRDAERSDYILQNWLRNRSTIEFIGLWEQLHNPNFKSIEFDGFKNIAGSNSFSLTPKRWIETTNAIGIVSKTGRYGGTYAHKDIVEFQRLKEDESRRLSLEWNLNRILSKVNYRIHTDAIKENIIPADITKVQEQFIYANEADVLNVALFGVTAHQWRKANPDKEGNVREHSTVEQLLVLANLESMNAEFIRMGLPQGERLRKLNTIAIQQLRSLVGNPNLKKLGSGE